MIPHWYQPAYEQHILLDMFLIQMQIYFQIPNS